MYLTFNSKDVIEIKKIAERVTKKWVQQIDLQALMVHIEVSDLFDNEHHA